MLSKVVSSITSIFSAKYYVSQQLAQMQAHNLNRERIIDKAGDGTATQKVIQDIFEKYDKAILADKYGWIKVLCKENKNGEEICELRLIKLDDEGRTLSSGRGKINPCDGQIHKGIFPPSDSIEAALEKCKSNIAQQRDYKDLVQEYSSFAKTYLSNIEYWILTLEALEQDMAL